jgi:GIY-YIG catalytic domain
MPQLVNFYKITSTNTPKVYIGSTVKNLEERLLGHTVAYTNYKNGYGNRTTSFIIIEFKNYSIHLLETALCLTKDDRNSIEQKHILSMPTYVNIMMPGRTQKQYYQDNKIKNSEKQTCYCSGRYAIRNKLIHFKSKKHQNFPKTPYTP